MNLFFSKLLNIRQEEGKKVFLLVTIFFVFITGTAWAETIIESSFYFLVGVSKLSQVFSMHAILAIITTVVYAAFVDQISNQKLMVVVCVAASGIIGLGILLLDIDQIFGYTILYVLVRAVRTAFVIHWWNYASDFYDARASKRIVPVINAASRLAIIVAGLTIPVLNRFLPAATIVLLWLITFIVIALLSFTMNKLITRENFQTNTNNFSKERVKYWENIKEGFQYVSNSSYLKWLALSTFLMVIVFGFLNYAGGKIFSQQFHSRADMTNFIGYLNGVTNLIMLPVQLFLFSRFVTKVGVGNANVTFPFGTFLIAGSVLFSPLTLASGALAHFDRNTFRYSTQESSNNLLYNAVPARVKGRSRSFIDGMILPIGLLASSALLEIGKLLPENLFLPVLLGIAAAAYLITSLVIRNLYSKAMITMLEQEDLAFLLPEDGDITLSSDPIAKNILLNKLVESQDDSVILLIARIMIETSGTKVMPILEMKTRESSPTVRAGIISLLAVSDNQTIQPKHLTRFMTTFLRDADENVQLAAFSGLKLIIGEKSQEFLNHAIHMIQDNHGGITYNAAYFEIRSQSLAALLESENPEYIKSAKNILNKMLRDPNPLAITSALSALGNISGSERELLTPILSYLDDQSDEVRLQAALSLEIRTKKGIPAAFVNDIRTASAQLLYDPIETVRLSALNILYQLYSQNSSRQNSIIESEELFLIINALEDPSEHVRWEAIEILVRNGSSSIPPILKLASDNEISTELKTNLIIVLCKINVNNFGEMAESQILVVLKNIYYRISQINALQGFPETPGLLTLYSMINELNHASMDSIFELLAARYGEIPVERITKSLAADSSHTQANASEALESLLSPALVKLIIPLYDPNIKVNELSRLGKITWPDTRPAGIPGIILELSSEPNNEILRALMVFSLGEIAPLLEVKAALPEVQNNRAKRINLLNKLFNDEATTHKADDISLQNIISLQEIQEFIQTAQSDTSDIVRNSALAAERAAKIQDTSPGEGRIMNATLTVIERIIFLKQVTLFQSMNIEQLKVLASICEDEYVEKNSIIFNEGDPGGVVYIIVNGRVGMERTGDRKSSIVRLATLEARSSFGEANLFEDNLRNSNAVAIENCLLLKLRAEPFLALIRQHPDMSIELIKVLNLRLNEANDQIAHLTRSTPRQLQSLYDKLEDKDDEL